MGGQRFEGRSLEEALETATRELGVARFQIDYHVVVEKRGFLGGLKRVVIEAEADPDRQPPASYDLSPAPAYQPEPRGRREGSRGGRAGGGRPRGGGRHEGSDGAFSERGGGAREREQIPAQDEQSAEAGAVSAWCEELFELSELDIVVRTAESGDRIDVRLFGRDASRTLDRNGELLDAIQVLANKALVHRKVQKPIELDARGFKEQRSEEIEEQARRAADRVRQSGREQLLPAMSPIERRIVHLALRDAGDVQTISRGDGFYKRVAILPKAEGESSDALEPQA
ncbi:MAG TPA: R3H domain-containing nucleic acid-binding protein [Thermoanaerobaculia bacterium]|nr:R3H domain-containing nucleic acid-binding protein [Thermoanaerobaculia bacterium]